MCAVPPGHARMALPRKKSLGRCANMPHQDSGHACMRHMAKLNLSPNMKSCSWTGSEGTGTMTGATWGGHRCCVLPLIESHRRIVSTAQTWKSTVAGCSQALGAPLHDHTLSALCWVQCCPMVQHSGDLGHPSDPVHLRLYSGPMPIVLPHPTCG